jgi:hypothetical protein
MTPAFLSAKYNGAIFMASGRVPNTSNIFIELMVNPTQ